jgi:site-specific DNA recombinase
VGLADKVHRGQEGKALQGLITGGRCYGYRNVPIEDPTRLGKYGRPLVTGVRAEIDEDQAIVIRRIFEMAAEGFSLTQIAKTLNGEGVSSPEPARGRQIRAWGVSSLHEMLRNERYRCCLVWNRTKKQLNPETGRKVSKARPESEWMRVDIPSPAV